MTSKSTFRKGGAKATFRKSYAKWLIYFYKILIKGFDQYFGFTFF